VFTKTYISKRPIEFTHCYRCGAAEGLSTMSVDTSRRSILDSLFVLLRFVGMLTNRETVTLPICKKCRSSIWLIRAVHLALVVACIFSYQILAPIVGNDDAILYGVLLALCGTLAAIVSYMVFRDRLLGVVVYPNERSYKYVVSRRFVAAIENEFEFH